ncbi:aldo/keto reductase [Lactiplantibacillus pentosus]|uniref:aldo/keto reductase n=1 Tax=Lactiplantibacillus pentosus TaxID=1589 RepID=UPI001CD1A87B|nr:aldo/keto reductase [Lactiplantibacillus pentosus]MCA1342553.1 aldo/keto reductase [Lactiplantibacillus pentosus]MCJ8184569.1 aldo/keto reductase [Lactiplantibacillus pentosus]
MQKRILGQNLSVSAIGYGAMGLSHAYGTAVEKNEAIKIIRTAFEQGYTLFDTAALYVGQYADGATAINEALVGEAIKPFRDQIVLATKGGAEFHDSKLVIDGSPEGLRKSVENSLRQLDVETIDLYYQHMPDPNVAPEVVADLMGQLIKEGKIKHWGISNAGVDYIKRADDVTKVTAVQDRFSMLARRKSEGLFPTLEKRQIGFVAYSPLASGFLTNQDRPKIDQHNKLDFRGNMHQFTEVGTDEAQAISSLVTQLADEKQASPAQISLAWVLKQRPWIVPIPGTSKEKRLIENADAVNIQLSDDEIKQMNRLLNKVNYDQFD